MFQKKGIFRMALNRRQQIDYTQRYQILSGRVSFADYVQRKQLINEGRLVGQNIYPPDNDFSIIPIIKEGETNTTPGELERYLAEVANVVPAPAPTPTPVVTVPDAPTSVSAVAGNSQATVSFTAPVNNGGSSITGYTVTSSPGGFTATGSSSPITVTELSNGTAYTFTVVATNSVGNSVASAPSASVTPVNTDPITVIILGDTGVTTLSTSLQSARTALGYSQTLTITTQQLNGYTGTNLSSFQVAILYTNGGLNLNATLGGNLNTFVTNGGHLIMTAFAWGNVSAISGFTYNSYSTYQYKGTYSSINCATAVYTVTHPITTGIATSTGLGSPNTPNPISLTTIPNSQVIATFGDPGSTSFIAVGQNGSARLVGINAYVATAYSGLFQNTLKYVCNSIYWCVGSI